MPQSPKILKPVSHAFRNKTQYSGTVYQMYSIAVIENTLKNPLILPLTIKHLKNSLNYLMPCII